MRRRSDRFAVLSLLPIVCLFCLFGPVPQTRAAWAQTASGQAQSAPAATPTQPEKQLQLNVDRDPIASPDGEEAPPQEEGVQPQTSPSRGRSGQYTFERNVDEVVLNVTVLDNNRHMVSNLTEPDFKVYEDGVEQTITSFQHQDIPISLGMIVDNSGSMRPKRQAVNQAALDLVRYSNPDDESFVVNFSDEAYIDQDFTANVAKLREGLSHIDAKGGTALYDAVVASADYLTKNAKRSKQVLLVITDGEDNASSTSLEETVRRIQAFQGPVVYCIGLLYGNEDSGRETRRARRALNLLASETGGVAFFPKNLDQVDEIASEVAKDIRDQYTIGYHSTKPPSLGGFRAVRVEAKAKGFGKLVVRTKTGYYPETKKPAPGKTSARAAAQNE